MTKLNQAQVRVWLLGSLISVVALVTRYIVVPIASRDKVSVLWGLVIPVIIVTMSSVVFLDDLNRATVAVTLRTQLRLRKYLIAVSLIAAAVYGTVVGYKYLKLYSRTYVPIQPSSIRLVVEPKGRHQNYTRIRIENPERLKLAYLDGYCALVDEENNAYTQSLTYRLPGYFDWTPFNIDVYDEYDPYRTYTLVRAHLTRAYRQQGLFDGLIYL